MRSFTALAPDKLRAVGPVRNVRNSLTASDRSHPGKSLETVEFLVNRKAGATHLTAIQQSGAVQTSRDRGDEQRV